MNNKEVHYEGWLIKSPPTKRIWRARWRRRWFTLKQGEIPEQFCLEYYTDRNCRKLKGVIDLDQCEQVDCGLRLENRKQKFQYMFDIKTPKRTYYLAADTEADMRYWVNCICQVCHLHDTKQTNDLPDDNQLQHSSSGSLTMSTQNTTTTSLHSSSGGASTGSRTTIDVLRRPGAPNTIIEQQPKVGAHKLAVNSTNNNSDSVYVNTDYTNRETMLCDENFDRQHLLSAAQQQPPPSPATALYLNHSALIQAQLASNNSAMPTTAATAPSTATAATTSTTDNARLAVSSNGVVRKLPENLVLNNQTLPDVQESSSVQPSPALSTASGPYIPISECFSGSPKFLLDSNNPTTPLNNLDPKFYDTPRSHNNIGLNLTNDQSNSPKITNCSLQQLGASGKNRSQRSDSDSESVFTDDDEWTHPMPLRENVDRSTRPSDSSIENESFVLTYAQRFSKLPDECAATDIKPTAGTMPAAAAGSGHTLEKLAKVLKNKNNLILDFKDNEKLPHDLPQLSDTENTSPAIGPHNVNSVVHDESYDIPRSHQMPYYALGQLQERMISPHTNPIAASTPNLMAAGIYANLAGATSSSGGNTPATVIGASTPSTVATSPASARTLPRKHCYTNAAPSKVVEGNFFRYDFDIERSDCPPVNRQLKPKMHSLDEKSKSTSIEDKPPEEFPAKPPTSVEQLTNKMSSTNIQTTYERPPPSVDRKCKPNAYKIGSAATMSPATRRSTGAPLSMVLPNDRTEISATSSGYITETRTLPRQPRPNYATGSQPSSPAGLPVHQRTASAAAAMQHMPTNSGAAPTTPVTTPSVPLPPKQANEPILQYFDLDVANKPQLNRQSLTGGNGNFYVVGGINVQRHSRETGIVYRKVDFVKTEAFKRIREERSGKESSECANKYTK